MTWQPIKTATMAVAPHLIDRGDGVRGHFCIGRSVGGVYYEFWHARLGWCSAGTVYVGREAAEAKLNEVANAPDQTRLQPSPEADCSVLRKRIAELEEELRQIAVWKQEDQDNYEICVLQWRGCVAIARELLKLNDRLEPARRKP